MTPRARLALTCLLVTVVVLGAAVTTPWTLSPPQLPAPELTRPPIEQPSGAASPGAEPVRPPDQVDSRWIILVLVTLVALLVAALITLAVRKLLAIHREPVDTTADDLAPGTATSALGDDVDLPELQDAVTRALAHLDGHPRPRDAVVAAWVALEEAAARAGTRRDPAQTPTEFTGTVLAATPAPADAVARLRTLYQRARFTDRPVDDAAVAQARTALAEIAASLDVGPLAPGGAGGPGGPGGPGGAGCPAGTGTTGRRAR